jgi:hypothetical protein
MTKKVMTCAIALAAAVVASSVLPAEAGKRHGHAHRHFKHWDHHYVVKPYGYATYVGPNCAYLYKKWRTTGSKHWKFKYFDCRYWR